MNLNAYRASLLVQEQLSASKLVDEYLLEQARYDVRYNPVATLADLEAALGKDRRRIRSTVKGLYQSISTGVAAKPAGWTIANLQNIEPDGTIVLQTDVTDPNGAKGLFERAFNPITNEIELRQAFLRLPGMATPIPTWVTGMGVDMVPGNGIPTVQYFTLYQLKLLGMTYADPRVKFIKMSTIHNVETILHLCWLNLHEPAANLDDLINHTASVQYAETTAIQCGYRVLDVTYQSAGQSATQISKLLRIYEKGNQVRINEHDALLKRYQCNRKTVMNWNFDIKLSIVPL